MPNRTPRHPRLPAPSRPHSHQIPRRSQPRGLEPMTTGAAKGEWPESIWRVHHGARRFRIAIPYHHPDDIRLIPIACSDIATELQRARSSIAQHLVIPAFRSSRVPEIAWSEDHVHPLLRRLLQNPIRMREIGFVWCGEISRSQKRSLAIAVQRPAELVFNQLNNQRIESLLSPVFQVDLRLFLGKSHDQTPWAISMDQNRRTCLILQVAMTRGHSQWIGNRSGDERF